MMDVHDRKAFLKRIPLFSNCSLEQLEKLGEKMVLVSIPKGYDLIKPNTAAEQLFVILSGGVLVNQKPFHEKATRILERGSLKLLQRGTVFGELSLISSDPLPYSVQANDLTDLLVLKKNDADRLIKKDPDMALSLLRSLTKHVANNQSHSKKMEIHPQLITMASRLAPEDAVLFTLSLGLALKKDSQGAILILGMAADLNRIAAQLNVEPHQLAPGNGNGSSLHHQEYLERHIYRHTCGLDVLLLENSSRLLQSHSDTQQFFRLVKTLYDYCLIIPSPTEGRLIPSFLSLSDHVLKLYSISEPEETDQEDPFKNLKNLTDATSEEVWLTADGTPLPPATPMTQRIPWQAKWSEEARFDGVSFIPLTAAMTLKRIGRLARSINKTLLGFAMGAGSAFGYALIGMLKALEKEDIYPDLLSGTSMGAIIGAFYSHGTTTDELTEIAKSMTKRRIWKMLDFGLPRSGIISGKGVLQFLIDHLGDRTFEQLNIPFACVATDIETGREVVFDSGNVAQAVRASISLPFFFQPHQLNGHFLVDGGLVNPVPTSVVIAKGANIILSANLTAKAEDREIPHFLGLSKYVRKVLPGPAIPEIMMRTIYTMQYEIAVSRSQMADVVMDLAPRRHWWWEFNRAEEIVAMGEQLAEEHLPKLKALLPRFGGRRGQV